VNAGKILEKILDWGAIWLALVAIAALSVLFITCIAGMLRIWK